MPKSTDALLEEIEAYCQKAGVAESTFGRHAINDGKLCFRLRAGKSVTLATAERVRTYISDNQPEKTKDSAAEPDRVARPLEPNPPDPAEAVSSVPDRPFRFYDNRQKYLAFVNTCNEKWKVAERASRELLHLKPQPPSLRLFDAGMGDGTVMSHVLRATHQRFPTLPFYVVGKEISLEDIRLSLEKLPDRLVEHPSSVFVFTNLHYRESPWLMPLDVNKAAALNWKTVELEGTSAYAYGQQLDE